MLNHSSVLTSTNVQHWFLAMQLFAPLPSRRRRRLSLTPLPKVFSALVFGVTRRDAADVPRSSLCRGTGVLECVWVEAGCVSWPGGHLEQTKGGKKSAGVGGDGWARQQNKKKTKRKNPLWGLVIADCLLSVAALFLWSDCLETSSKEMCGHQRRGWPSSKRSAERKIKTYPKFTPHVCVGRTVQRRTGRLQKQNKTSCLLSK